jgi:hypothetical protein
MHTHSSLMKTRKMAARLKEGVKQEEHVLQEQELVVQEGICLKKTGKL